MKNLLRICKMNQPELKSHLEGKLLDHFPAENIVSDNGYLYAQGTIPVLLVAHLDTVHKETPKTILYDKETAILSSPEGIGGDDRAGVYIILEILKRHNCSVLFCEDEEMGGIGAHKFTESKLSESLKFHFAIEFDRQNGRDAVFYDCANGEFEDFITKEYFHTNYGSFSDISILAPYLGCAAVNLSCGYYNPHTKNEYIAFRETRRIVREACKILERATENDVFEYIESPREWDGAYDYYYPQTRQSGITYWITYTDSHGNTKWYDARANSQFEAIGMFAIDTDLPYSSIIDIYRDI